MNKLNADQALLVKFIQEDLNKLDRLKKKIKRFQTSSPRQVQEWLYESFLLEFHIKDGVQNLGITVLADHLQAIWIAEKQEVVIKDRQIRYVLHIV